MAEEAQPVRRNEWLLDPDISFLNHGSYGAVPRSILSEQRRLQERMERNPAGLFALELPHALRACANQLGRYVKASEPISLLSKMQLRVAIQCWLRSGFLRGDEIVVTDHGYPAIRKAAEYHAARAGAAVVEATIAFPTTDPMQIINAVAARLGPRSRLVILATMLLRRPPSSFRFASLPSGVTSRRKGYDRWRTRPKDVGARHTRDDADWYVGNYTNG
jgi:isopenicillin-N epimerase